MKNYFIIFMSLLFVTTFYSCSDENILSGKANWEFTIKMVTSTSPAVKGYPQTTTTTITKYDLTLEEAEKFVQENTTTVKQSQYIAGFGTLSVTVKSTCTKRKIS